MADDSNETHDDVGHSKLFWEVEKLKAEVQHLRRPLLANPSTWVAGGSALAALFGIGLQYLSSQAKIEQADLKLQKAAAQIADADKALQEKDLAIKQRNDALADLERRQLEVERQIADKQKALAGLLEAATKGADGGTDTARAVQQVIESAQRTLSATRAGIEADRIATLVAQMNDTSAEVRKAATARLEHDHAANPIAVGLVLDTLSEQNLSSLSASGRINALYFLNQSDLAAWRDEHKKLAGEAITRLRARAANGSVVVGPQTSEALGKLERRLDHPTS